MLGAQQLSEMCTLLDKNISRTSQEHQLKVSKKNILLVLTENVPKQTAHTQKSCLICVHIFFYLCSSYIKLFNLIKDKKASIQ